MALSTNHNKRDSDRAFAADQTVQVLALDGGGLRGLFSAAVIEGLEAQLGHSITNHFDLITGTSTGGLIALGLALGRSGKELAHFYKEEGPRIFPNSGLQKILRFLRWLVVSKYSSHQLERALRKFLVVEGQAEPPLLRDSRKRLVIPTYLATTSQPRLLKTPHDRRYQSDWRLPMWAVGMATSAAPTYLPSYRGKQHTYLDGGLWANNPSLLGVVEALEMGASRSRVRVLNLTTTSTNSECFELRPRLLPWRIPYGRLGLLAWSIRLLPLMMQANSYASTQMYLHQLLAAGNHAVVDDTLSEGHASLDSINYEELYSRGISAAEHAMSGIADFFRHTAPPYAPDAEAITDARPYE